MKTLAENGKGRAKLVLKLSNDYNKLLSTILIGNNIVNIAVASLGTLLFVDIYNDADLGATISTVVVTVVVLIFGEISPKSIAKDMPETISMFSAPLLQLLIWILTPINAIFWVWKKFLSLFFRKSDADKMSQEELLMFVEEVQEGGTIDTDEGHLLRNAIEFGDLAAEDVLTHRVDLEAFELGTPKEEVAKLFDNSKFSRLLVYADDIDNIVGILHLKDFYNANGITDKPLKSLITPPIFVHKTEKISDLLKTLKANKSHIAVVLDEFGGTLGIVTMEDILEELVGEIWDEHDDVLEYSTQTDENTYRINCDMSLDDFAQQFDMDIPAESNTVNGWVAEQLDKVPDKGDKFVYKTLDVTVTDTDSHRVTYISVKVVPEQITDDKDSKDNTDTDKNSKSTDNQSTK